MASNLRGSARLFQVAGIDVFVHWSWLLVAWLELRDPPNKYQSQVWNVIEYLAIFAIVTLHEFGHALACRQVGGKANQIVLWPLGGLAFVQPPSRPGALFWTIAAGPLVNVVLVPVLFGASIAGEAGGLENVNGDAVHFLWSIAWINVGLLIFNLLPLYPLDGGRLLQSLLWFVIGRVWSLRIAAGLGLLAGVGLAGLSFVNMQWFGVFMALFIASQCLAALRAANSMSHIAKIPRRAEYACPGCKSSPPIGNFWMCRNCKTLFDTFQHLALCPGCRADLAVTQCPTCEAQHPLPDWVVGPQVVEARVVDPPFDDQNPYAAHRDFA